MATGQLFVNENKFMEEFHISTSKLHGKIVKTVTIKLSSFKEFTNAEEVAHNCLSDIERILSVQMVEFPIGHFNKSEKQRKLRLFNENPKYIDRYVIEATKSFCRKKRHYWTHGRNKGKKEVGEHHKAIKQGRAARVHAPNVDDGTTWIESIAESDFSLSILPEQNLIRLVNYLKTTRLSDEKVSCILERLEGMTFVEMAKEDPDPLATPDKYRKRYHRAINRVNIGKIKSIIIDSI